MNLICWFTQLPHRRRSIVPTRTSNAGSKSRDLHPYQLLRISDSIEEQPCETRGGDMPGQISRSMRITRSGRCTTEQLIPPHRPPSPSPLVPMPLGCTPQMMVLRVESRRGNLLSPAHLYRNGKYDALNNRLFLWRNSARAIPTTTRFDLLGSSECSVNKLKIKLNHENRCY